MSHDHHSHHMHSPVDASTAVPSTTTFAPSAHDHHGGHHDHHNMMSADNSGGMAPTMHHMMEMAVSEFQFGSRNFPFQSIKFL